MNKTLVIGFFHEESFASHIYHTLRFSQNEIVYPFDVSISLKGILNLKFVKKFAGSIQYLVQRTKFHENLILKQILDIVDDKEINLIIVCHDFLTPHQIDEIKKNREIKVVLWFPDPVGQIHRGMFMNADYDILFFKDKFICDILREELNFNTVYLPECCNPLRHRPIELNSSDFEKYQCDITTAGNLPSNRIRLFDLLSTSGYDIKLWGNPAPYWSKQDKIKSYIQNEFVSNEEKSKAFRAAKIVINNLRVSEVGGTNVRTFEIAACHAFQLTSYRPNFEELYDSNEVVTFTSYNDMVEKIDYYINRPEERHEIAKNAYVRTINEHTYEKRLDFIFSLVE